MTYSSLVQVGYQSRLPLCGLPGADVRGPADVSEEGCGEEHLWFHGGVLQVQ